MTRTTRSTTCVIGSSRRGVRASRETTGVQKTLATLTATAVGARWAVMKWGLAMRWLAIGILLVAVSPPPRNAGAETLPGRSFSFRVVGPTEFWLNVDWFVDGWSPFLLRLAPGATRVTGYFQDLVHPETLPAGVPWACYQFWALRASPPASAPGVAASDLLCGFPGLRSADWRDSSSDGLYQSRIGISLLQSNTAHIAWDPVVGATSYALIALGTPRIQLVPPRQPPLTGVVATDDTGGQLTCYVAIALPTLANSDVVCGIPGRFLAIS